MPRTQHKPSEHNTGFFRAGPDHLWIHMIQSILAGAQAIPVEEIHQRITAMLAGIQKYQQCLVPPRRRRLSPVWQNGTVKILRMAGHKQGRPTRPVLLIPSLINGWEVFDLLPDRSFARYLTRQGFDVHILDWGKVSADSDIQDIDDLLTKRLVPAVQDLAQKTGQKVVTMGYCMGGLLMAGAIPFMHDHVARAVYLATPWDFHADTPRLTTLVQGWVPSVALLMNTTSVLPNAQMQALFALIDPDMAAQKFARFGTMQADDPEYQTFIAVEDWLRSGRDLPARLAYACLQDWYVRNKTGHGTWRVAGARIGPSSLRAVPSVVVVPTRDRLVEPQTAHALFDMIGSAHATCITPDIGHIGMMSSARAESLVWERVVAEM